MDHNLEETALRIITGNSVIQIGDEEYILKSPNAEIRHKAAKLYNKTLHENRFGSWVSPQYCLHLLVSNGLCTADIDNNIKQIEKTIDDLKVELFTTLFMTERHQRAYKQLIKTREKYEDMINKRHMFDYLTLAGFAEMIKRQYIICETLYNSRNTKLWDTIDSMDSLLLEAVMHHINTFSLSAQQIRKIARTDPWRSHYSLCRENPFNKNVVDYSDEQRTLLLFTKMYESAYEHPECPPDDVLDDDDLFDGWMIKERRKRESDKNAQEMDRRIGKSAKIKESQEVFVVARDREDARKINNMNDVTGHMVKQQRKQLLKQKGKAQDGDFQDVKIDLQNKSKEQFINKVKGHT